MDKTTFVGFLFVVFLTFQSIGDIFHMRPHLMKKL